MNSHTLIIMINYTHIIICVKHVMIKYIYNWGKCQYLSASIHTVNFCYLSQCHTSNACCKITSLLRCII